MLVCGKREAMVMALPPMHDSAVSPCFHGCLAFLHRHFPPRSPPSHRLNPPLHSQPQPLPWDCSTIPKLQLTAAAPSWRPGFLSGIYDCGKDCLILIPFRLPQIHCLTLSLKCFSSDSDSCFGDQTPASVPPPAEGRSSSTNTPIFPPSSFLLPSLAWFYISFSTGLVLLSTLSWCSASVLCLKVYS